MPSIRLLTHARYGQGAALVVCTAVCLVRYEHAVAGVLWGGLLMALNLHAISYLVGRCQSGQKLGGVFAAAVGSKFVILMAGALAVMQGFAPDLLGFAVGLSTFFAGIAAALVSMQWGRPTLHPSSIKPSA